MLCVVVGVSKGITVGWEHSGTHSQGEHSGTRIQDTGGRPRPAKLPLGACFCLCLSSQCWWAPWVSAPSSGWVCREAGPAKPLILVRPGAGEQKAHSLTLERLEVVQSMDAWAEEKLLPLLKPVEECWQPQDYVPHPEQESFLEEVQELRRRAAHLPDDYFVCLVGDTITEEALPTYQTMLNTLDGTRDETGASPSPWGVWTRAWTAEENRHGDLLNRYLYLSGRVDMRAVEKTIQYLIGSGMVRPCCPTAQYLTVW